MHLALVSGSLTNCQDFGWQNGKDIMYILSYTCMCCFFLTPRLVSVIRAFVYPYLCTIIARLYCLADTVFFIGGMRFKSFFVDDKDRFILHIQWYDDKYLAAQGTRSLMRVSISSCTGGALCSDCYLGPVITLIAWHGEGFSIIGSLWGESTGHKWILSQRTVSRLCC